MRLISLTLENFQAHEKLELDFGSSITVLRGASDVGKSAVLRALRWICQNDIAGDEFIRYGTKQAVVTLTIKTGKETHEIVRVRGKGENSYKLEAKNTPRLAIRFLLTLPPC